MEKFNKGLGGHACEEKVLNSNLYIIQNPAFPDWVKIGRTSRDVDERISDFRTAVPFDYKKLAVFIGADADVRNAESALRQFIKTLKPRHEDEEIADGGSEFIRIGEELIPDIVRQIKSIVKLHNEEVQYTEEDESAFEMYKEISMGKDVTIARKMQTIGVSTFINYYELARQILKENDYFARMNEASENEIWKERTRQTKFGTMRRIFLDSKEREALEYAVVGTSSAVHHDIRTKARQLLDALLTIRGLERSTDDKI